MKTLGFIFALLLTGHAFAYSPTDSCANGKTTPPIATVSCSMAGTIPSGYAVFGMVSWASSGGQTLSSVTDDKSNSYTIVDTLSNGTIQTATFYKLNVPSLPQTLTATLSLPATYPIIAATVYHFDPLATLDGHAMASQVNPAGTDSITSGTFSTTPGNLVIAYTGNEGFDSTLALGTGYAYSQQFSPAGNDYVIGAVKTASSSSVAATWTPSVNDSWVTGGMAFKPSSAGGGGGLLLMGCCQ